MKHLHEFQQQLTQARRHSKWQDAYDILEPLRLISVGEDLAWVKEQLALTLFSQSPANLADCLRLNDEAFHLAGDCSVQRVRCLINGLTFALYKADHEVLNYYCRASRPYLVGDVAGPWAGRLAGNVGYAYIELGDLIKAEEHLVRALRFYDTNVGPYSLSDSQCQMRLLSSALADLLLKKGHHKRAKDIYHGLVVQQQDEGYLEYLQAQIARIELRTEDASRLFSEALRRATERTDQILILKSAMGLAEVYSALGDPERVRHVLQPLILAAARGRMVGLVIRLQRLLRRIDQQEVIGL